MKLIGIAVICGVFAACSNPLQAPLDPIQAGTATGAFTSGNGAASSTTGGGTGVGTTAAGTATSGISDGSASSGGSGTAGRLFSCDLGDGGLYANPITINTGLKNDGLQSDEQYIAVGDVNNDAALDIVATDLATGDVVVLLGNGDGTFQSPVHTTVPASSAYGPNAVAIAQLGSPPVPSVVISDYLTNSLFLESVLADGSLAVSLDLFMDGGGPTWALAADLNGDGIPDLVNGGRWVSVFLGTASDGYIPAGYVNAECTYEPCLGDFNDDGILDIIGGQDSPPTSLFVYPGRGDGTFASAGNDAGVIGPGSYLVWRIGDLNEDHHLDLLVYSPYGSGWNAVFLGRGDGTFEVGTAPTTLAAGWPDALQDLDGDGHLDYVAHAFFTGVLLALGNGDGTFGLQSVVDSPNVLQVEVGDVNNDGRPDLIASNYASTVSIYLNNCR